MRRGIEISLIWYRRFIYCRLKKENYEKEVISLVKSAKVLNTTRSPCDKDFIPAGSSSGTPYVLYIKMKREKDTKTWLKVAKVGLLSSSVVTEVKPTADSSPSQCLAQSGIPEMMVSKSSYLCDYSLLDGC